MGVKARSVVLIVLGVSLLVAGVDMRSARRIWSETTERTRKMPGTKGRNAVIGAGVGAVGGGILAATIGGVGIVACGTGIGLPAGVILIGTAAGLGAGGGAIVGAATGRSPTTAPDTQTTTFIVPAYDTWQWGFVIAFGTVLLILAVMEIRRLRNPDAAGPAAGK